MEFSDGELVREIRRGSAIAFEQLMERYQGLVYHVAYGFTHDREGALDVMQETFLKAYRGLDRWRGEGELKGWLARIAAHEALNRRRSAPAPAGEADTAAWVDLDPPQEHALAAREAHDALARSLAALPPRQRLAVVLRYFQGSSTREIAAALDCSEGTARNVLFRSLARLRSLMTAAEEILP